MKGVRWSLWVLVAFAALLGLFALQLSRPKNDTVESTMIDLARFTSRIGMPNPSKSDGNTSAAALR